MGSNSTECIAPKPELLETFFIAASEYNLPDPMTSTHKVGVKINTCGFVVSYPPGADPAPLIREKLAQFTAQIEERMLAAIKEPA